MLGKGGGVRGVKFSWLQSGTLPLNATKSYTLVLYIIHWQINSLTNKLQTYWTSQFDLTDGWSWQGESQRCQHPHSISWWRTSENICPITDLSLCWISTNLPHFQSNVKLSRLFQKQHAISWCEACESLSISLIQESWIRSLPTKSSHCKTRGDTLKQFLWCGWRSLQWWCKSD